MRMAPGQVEALQRELAALKAGRVEPAATGTAAAAADAAVRNTPSVGTRQAAPGGSRPAAWPGAGGWTAGAVIAVGMLLCMGLEDLLLRSYALV